MAGQATGKGGRWDQERVRLYNRRDHAAAWLVEHRLSDGLYRIGSARPVSEADLPEQTITDWAVS